MCVQCALCITTVVVVAVEVVVSECTTTDGGNVALSRTCVCAQTLTFASELALLPCYNTYVSGVQGAGLATSRLRSLGVHCSVRRFGLVIYWENGRLWGR